MPASTFSFEDASQPSTGAFSFEDAQPKKAVGALSYIGQQAKAGLTADLPTIAGKALQYAGATDLGAKLRAVGEENAAAAQPDESRGAVTKLVASAVRGAAPIVPLAASELLAPAAIAAPIALGGAAALAGGFGGAQAQDTFEKAKAAGLSDEQATSTARKTGLITGAGMAAVGALTGGLAAPAVRAIAAPAARTAAESLADTAAPAFVRPFVAETAGHLAGNVASMAAANAGTAAVEKSAGLPGPTPGQAALEGIESGAGLTAALLPFGAARTALARRANTAAVNRLQSADTEPEQRAAIAAQIHANLNAIDPEAAGHFANNVANAIDAKQPIDLGEHLLTPIQPAAEPAAPLALPAPVVRVDAQGNAVKDGQPPPVLDEPQAPLPKITLRERTPTAGEVYQPGDTTNPLTGERIPAAPTPPAPPGGGGGTADVTDVVPKSERMGIDASAGPVSRVAAIAVDSGAHDTAVAQAAADAAAKAPKGKTPDEKVAEAQPGPQAAAPDANATQVSAGPTVVERAGSVQPVEAARGRGQPPAAVEGARNERTGAEPGASVSAGGAARVEPTVDRGEPNPVPVAAPRPGADEGSAAAPAPQVAAAEAVNKVPVGTPYRTRLAAAPALRRAGPGHEIIALSDGGFAIHRIETEAAAPKPLSIGMTPNSTEPVTVKDGVVHIGKNPAVDFDSGEPVKVKADASHETIKQALRDANALSRRQRFFGGEQGAETPQLARKQDADKTGAPAPVRYGIDGTALHEGGRPFPTKLAADAARKDIVPQGRSVKVEGGYALRDLTDAELAARTASGNRLQASLRAKSYEANPLLAFLAEHGLYHEEGKRNSLKSEFSPDAEVSVRGYGKVFRPDGLQIDEIAQRASEAGFLPRGTEDTARMSELIRKAIDGKRVIPEHAKGVVEREYQRQTQEHIDQHAELADLVPHDLDAEGYDRSSPELQARVRELIAKAEAGSVDYEAILEDLARKYENASTDEFNVHARHALEDALKAADAGAGSARAESRGGPAGAQASEPQSRQGEGLSSPTQRDVLAQQEREKNAPTLDEKAAVDREAQHQTLTPPTPAEKKVDTGDMFAREKAQAELDKKNAGKPKDDGGTTPMFARKTTVPVYSALTAEGQPLFKRSAQETPGTRAADLRKTLAPALDKLKVPFALHDNIDQLRKAAGEAIPNGVQGMYFKGKLHLVGEGIGSPLEAEQIFWHEVNHAGVDKVYGSTKNTQAYYDAMRGLAIQNANIRAAAKEWLAKYGKTDTADRVAAGWAQEAAERRTKLQAVEEALSELAGRNAKISGATRFIAKVQEFLRSVGLDRLADWLENRTDAQALAMIFKAREAVMEQPAASGSRSPVPSFSQRGAIELDPEFMKKPIGEQVRLARVQAMQNFAGRVVRNASDGKDIQIPGSGIKKALSGRVSPVAAAAALHLDRVIENAKYVRSEPDPEGRNTIKEVRVYEAVVTAGDKDSTVRVIVRVAPDGTRYYDHFELKEKGLAGMSGEQGAPGSLRPSAGPVPTEADAKIVPPGDGEVGSFSRTLDAASAALDRIKGVAAAKDVGTAWDGLVMATAPQYRSDAAREMARQIIAGIGEKEMRSIRFRTQLNAAIREQSAATTLSAKARDLLEKGLTVRADKVFLRNTPEENSAFMQAVDTGDAAYFEAHADLKPLADVISKMFDEKAKAVQALDTGALQAVRENYFPHIWKEEPDADAQKQIYSTLSKRPLEGRKAFTKQRVFEDVQAGLDAGYEPISNNPLDLVALKMEEMDKYVLAHTVLSNMEGTNGVHLIAAGEKTPKGYADVNGRFGSIERNGEKLRYVAREDVAQVINNYLSASLYHNKYVGKPFTAYMGAANTLNQFQLGVFSAFHAGFTSMEAVISHASLGVKALTAGDFKGAAKYLSSAPAAWITNPKLGSKIIEAMTGTAAHPELAPILEGLQLAGFKWQMDNRFRTDATKNMLTAWQEGKKFKAGLNSIPALVEQTARPILEWLVPRQKFGVFGEMYSKWMNEHPGATHEEMRNEAQQIWNRVDSRLGQVVYDRLFMHNVSKNFAQMLIRAPGWTGGTILEVGGGIKDLAGYMKALATGKRPESISDRAAYTLSMLAVTALSNAILTAVFTGDAPQDWRDLVAFRTGNLDERGRPERFMLPTYMKDVHAYVEAPGHTLVAKAHPLLSLVADVARNRDFYGTEIRSEDAGVLTQLAETAGFTAKAFIPFWAKGVQKVKEREGGALATVAPLVGVMPAPTVLDQTAAEKLMSKYAADRLPQGSRTKEETEKADLRRQMYLALRKGEPDKAKELFDQGREQGLFGPRDFLKVMHDARQDPLQVSFSRLSLDQAKRVLAVASEDEKTELAPLFMKKRMAWQRQHGTAATAE